MALPCWSGLSARVHVDPRPGWWNEAACIIAGFFHAGQSLAEPPCPLGCAGRPAAACGRLASAASSEQVRLPQPGSPAPASAASGRFRRFAGHSSTSGTDPSSCLDRAGVVRAIEQAVAPKPSRRGFGVVQRALPQPGHGIDQHRRGPTCRRTGRSRRWRFPLIDLGLQQAFVHAPSGRTAAQPRLAKPVRGPSPGLAAGPAG